MIGVDTNVLVRLVVRDDQQQNEAAKAFFADRSADDPAYVSAIVLAETIWLLKRHFGYSRSAVENVVRGILSTDDFVVEYDDHLQQIIQESASVRSQVADYLIAWSAEKAGCTCTMTFDRRAARAISSMELLS